MTSKQGDNVRQQRHRDAGLDLEIAELCLMMALCRRELLSLKAGFDRDQPRHPRGSGRIGGRWRDAGGSGRGPRVVRPPRSRTPARPLKLPPAGVGHNGGPPLEDPPPQIPERDPGTERARHRIAKGAAIWLLRALRRAPDVRIRIVAIALEKVGYLGGYFEDIEAALDRPRSIDELRRAVRSQAGRPGTQIHHIVERTPALQDGFSASQIDGYENLVRIPRYRHEEITAWYQTRNDNYGGRTPRDHLRGRSWEERLRIGLDKLREEGLIE